MLKIVFLKIFNLRKKEILNYCYLVKYELWLCAFVSTKLIKINFFSCSITKNCKVQVKPIESFLQWLELDFQNHRFAKTSEMRKPILKDWMNFKNAKKIINWWLKIKSKCEICNYLQFLCKMSKSCYIVCFVEGFPKGFITSL